MKKIRTILVEDEPPAMDRLRSFVRRDSDVEIVAECGDGTKAVESIQTLQPDLVFLDIQIPEMDGFEVLRKIGPARMPLVVFVTAYDEYAVKAFEVCALDYILKPFDRARVEQSLQRVRMEKDKVRSGALEQKLLDLLNMRRSPYLQRILVKASGRLTFVNVREIDWIKAEGNYLELHYGKNSCLLRGALHQMESQLDPDMFLRTHRSVMVRIDAIREIQSAFGGSFVLIMKDGSRLPMSRRHRRKLPPVGES